MEARSARKAERARLTPLGLPMDTRTCLSPLRGRLRIPTFASRRSHVPLQFVPRREDPAAEALGDGVVAPLGHEFPKLTKYGTKRVYNVA